MGSMDCLTTVIGIAYFGAVECNPFLTGLVSTNLLAFIMLKMVTTVFVGLLFIQADKILMKTQDKTSKTFNITHKILKTAYLGIVAFLIVVVANNLYVLVTSL